MKEMERKTQAILKIIGAASEPIGSAEIAQKLKENGIEMSERTVRYHLKTMNEAGMTKIFWKEGRLITQKGLEEINNALVSDKVGLMSARIEALAYKMSFDLYKKEGSVILNVSFFSQNDFPQALKVMRPIFEKKLTTSNKVVLAKAGASIGGLTVPEGMVGWGTLCSINLNGVLLKHALPLESKFGGLMQIEEERLIRFTDIINYDGTTLDPHEIFLKSQMTSVWNAATQGAGKILAGLREIPAASRDEAEAIIRKSAAVGIGRALALGKAGQPLFGMPVGAERVGLVVPGGLNPIAALEEQGITTSSKALVALVEYKALQEFSEI